MRYLFVEVGCLECGNPTVLHGVFASLDEARAAAAAGMGGEPVVLEAGEVVGETTPGDPWHGEAVPVIFEIDELAG